MPDITNKTVFEPLEEFIRTEEYSDADLLNLIGNFAGSQPEIARAMAFHARDIIHQHSSEDIAYVDIVVQVYYRTFFSPEHAGLYGTDYMVHSPEKLAEFVQYHIDPNNTEVSDAAALPTQFTTH